MPSILVQYNYPASGLNTNVLTFVGDDKLDVIINKSDGGHWYSFSVYGVFNFTNDGNKIIGVYSYTDDTNVARETYRFGYFQPSPVSQWVTFYRENFVIGGQDALYPNPSGQSALQIRLINADPNSFSLSGYNNINPVAIGPHSMSGDFVRHPDAVTYTHQGFVPNARLKVYETLSVPVPDANNGVQATGSASSAVFSLGSQYAIQSDPAPTSNDPYDWILTLDQYIFVMAWEGAVDTFTTPGTSVSTIAKKVDVVGTDSSGNPIYRGLVVMYTNSTNIIDPFSVLFAQAVKGDLLKASFTRLQNFEVIPTGQHFVSSGSGSNALGANPNSRVVPGNVVLHIVLGGSSRTASGNWYERIGSGSLGVTMFERQRIAGSIASNVSLGSGGPHAWMSTTVVLYGTRAPGDLGFSWRRELETITAATKTEVQYRYYSASNLLKTRYGTGFGYHVRGTNAHLRAGDPYGGSFYRDLYDNVDAWLPIETVDPNSVVTRNPPTPGTITAERIRTAFENCVSAWGDLGFETVHQMPLPPVPGGLSLEPSIPALIGEFVFQGDDPHFVGPQVRGRAETIAPGVLRLGGKLEDGTDATGAYSSGVIVVLAHADAGLEVIAHAPPTIDRPHEFYGWDRTKLDQAKINQALEAAGGFISDSHGTLPSSSTQASTWHGIPIAAGAKFTAARVRGKAGELFGVIVTGTGANRTVSIGQTGKGVLYTAPLEQWLPPGSTALLNAGDPIMGAGFMHGDWPGPTGFLEFKPITGTDRVRLNLRIRSRKDVANVRYGAPSNGPPGPAPPVVFAGLERASVSTSQHTGLEWLKPSAIAVTAPELPVTNLELSRLNAPLPAEQDWNGFKTRTPKRFNDDVTVTFLEPYPAPNATQWALEAVRVWVRGSGTITASGVLSDDPAASSVGIRVLTLEPTTTGLTITFTAAGLDVLAIRALPIGKPA